MEFYIDDMLIKSKLKHNYLEDLAKAFTILCIYDVTLNLENCGFGVQVSIFVGYLVTKCGIKASRQQIKAL